MKSKGEGAHPPLKRGRWMPGVPRRQGGKHGLCWERAKSNT